MKITNWNCKYDYYNKVSFNENKEKFITCENEDTDLFVIEECTYADCIRLKEKYKFVTWFGDGKDSILGIGTFSQKYDLKIASEFNFENKFRYIAPYVFYEKSKKINIFLIWAKTRLYYQSKDNKRIYDKNYKFEYVENVYEAMIYYKNLLTDNTIIIGDFNSGITPNNINKKHDELVEYLKQNNIKNCSLYFNLEKSPTFFQIDKHGKENMYTDDYCFVSDNIKVEKYIIGEKGKYSDHFPITLELNI
jgi:exonuclease III